MTLRITTEDLLKGQRNPYQHAARNAQVASEKNKEADASGLIHESNACAIVPVSNEARLDMMLNHGQPYDADKNDFIRHVVMSHPTEMNAGNLRRAFKVLAKGEMWKYKGFTYDPALIKSFTKHFKRVNDTFTLHGGGSILFILGPDKDWGFYIALRMADEDKPKTFNPITGEWE